MTDGISHRSFVSVGRFVLISAAALTLICALTLESKAESSYVNPHIKGATGFCGECHSNPPELLAGNVAVCVRCHKSSTADHPVTRHPIDRVVRITTPSPLPLTRDNKIVCSTCHDPHAGSGFRAFLRVKYNTLCIQCHVDY